MLDFDAASLNRIGQERISTFEVVMRSPFFIGVGGVVSADIAVPEHARELAFYAKVLTTGQEPLWRDDLCNSLGTPIIGLGERIPEYESLPLQWMPHFQVADVAESAARALELGGKELMHGKDDDGNSLWAGLVDPNGAGFGVIPVVGDDSYEASIAANTGRISWLSLLSSDVRASGSFYESVVGWTAAEASGGAIDMLGPDSITAADIRPYSDDTQDITSVWLIHVPVGDLSESLRHVREGGGEVAWESGSGHAVIRDPVGVYFGLQSTD